MENITLNSTNSSAAILNITNQPNTDAKNNKPEISYARIVAKCALQSLVIEDGVFTNVLGVFAPKVLALAFVMQTISCTMGEVTKHYTDASPLAVGFVRAVGGVAKYVAVAHSLEKQVTLALVARGAVNGFAYGYTGTIEKDLPSLVNIALPVVIEVIDALLKQSSGKEGALVGIAVIGLGSICAELQKTLDEYFAAAPDVAVNTTAVNITGDSTEQQPDEL